MKPMNTVDDQVKAKLWATGNQMVYVHRLGQKLGLSMEGVRSRILLWTNKEIGELKMIDADKVIKCLKSEIKRGKEKK